MGLLVNGQLHKPTVRVGVEGCEEICDLCAALWPCLAVVRRWQALQEEAARHTPGREQYAISIVPWVTSTWVRYCERCLNRWPCRDFIAGQRPAP